MSNLGYYNGITGTCLTKPVKPWLNRGIDAKGGDTCNGWISVSGIRP